MVKNCPYCGASLHEEASFCPYCAKSVNQRKQPHPPRYISGRALWSAGVLLAVLVLVLLAVFWYRLRPRVYDNDSTEVIYRDQGVDYQLCIAWANAPFTPADRVRESSAPLYEICRYPVLLYINLAGTETFAADTFLELVESITGEISGADPEIQITCSEAVRDTDHVPNSAAILYMNPMVTSSGPHSAELTISVRMKNGDIIRLHQTQTMEGIITHHFTSDDTPLNTVNDLEILLARLDEMVGPEDKVYIPLPPVTYTEELFVSGRAINFTGSTDEAGNRTTFTAPIRVESERGWVFFWEGFDLLGSGEGTGLSAAARVHLTDCRIAGWETGVLAHTSAWVNADECVFEDNAAGVCFDAERGNPSDSRYVNNLFRSNGTAVLLAQVPNDVSLKFPGTRFQNNGIDIDNRCEQKLELDEAIFE